MSKQMNKTPRVEQCKLRDDIFVKLLSIFKHKIIEVKSKDLHKYLYNPSLMNKNYLYYNRETNKFIVQKAFIYQVAGINNYDDAWAMLYCRLCGNMTEPIRYIVYNTQATRYMKAIILNSYTEEEYEECLDKCTVDEHIIPIHRNPPIHFNLNTIYKLDNCVYYDMNNAHLYALTLIFPKAAQDLIHLRERINKLKANKEYTEAQKLKDIVNIYVGELGSNKRPRFKKTNEWIVNLTKNLLQSLINKVGGSIIYANTDGVIIYNPEHKIETSNRLGEFKDELTDKTVYLLMHKGKTNYTLYQYENNGINLKGTALTAVRNQIDLSKGLYVDYERVKVEGGWIATNVTQLKGEIYEKRVQKSKI